MKPVTSIALLFFTAFAAACAAPPASEEDEIGARSDAITATFFDTPTSVTVYSEAGLWGDSHTVDTTPTSIGMQSNYTSPVEISAAGLMGRISSARVRCGTRPTAVYFFDSTGSPWAGDWVEVDCAPGASATVNFHVTPSLPSGTTLGDRITSFLTVEETVPDHWIPFGTPVRTNWNASIGSLLGSNAWTTAPVELTYLGLMGFRIHQDIHIHVPFPCPDADGWLEYTANFSVAGGTPVWHVVGTSDAWGAWICNDDVKSRLQDAVAAGAPTLSSKLATVTAALGSHASFFLLPQGGTYDFMLHYGP